MDILSEKQREIKMKNVFKAVTTVTIDKEKTAIYKTVKHVFLFNLDLLPIGLGLKMLAYLEKEQGLEGQTTETISGNVKEYRTEYVTKDDLETLKKKV